MNAFASIATFYREGGIFMHAVLVIGIVIAAILVERVLVLWRASGAASRRLADHVVQLAARGDVHAARQAAMGQHTPVAQVAQAMLGAGATDEETLHNAADDAATLVMPGLTRRLPHLAVLANSATLIGLLGTITGLITAISGVGVADAAQRSAHLSAGISEALHTTAFGLIVAIPTLLVHGFLTGRVESIANDMDHLSIRLGRALAHPAGTPVARVAAPRPLTAAAPLASPLPVARAAQGGGQ